MAVENVNRSSQRGLYMLVGGAGVPNYGDELIVDKWAKWLTGRSDLANFKYVVELNHPKVSRMFGYGSTPRVFPSGDLSFAKYLFGGGSFAEMFDRGVAFAAEGAKDKPLDRLYDRISRSSVFHLHGGGYLNDYWPAHAFSLGLGYGIKKKWSTRVIGTGLGLGPFNDPESSARLSDAAAAFDHFEVRDSESAQVAGSEAHLGTDDIFLGSVGSSVTCESALHISMSDRWSGTDFSSVFSKSFINSYDRIYFWVCTPRDANIFASLGDSHRHLEAVHVRDLLRTVPCGLTNFMVSDRFHPHLVGARLGFAGAYFSANPYYDAKHGSVVRLGSKFSAWDGSVPLEGVAETALPSFDMAKGDASVVSDKNSRMWDAVQLPS